MRICLYWFNLAAPPGMSIGVSILARALSDAGHEIQVLHLNERVGLPFDIGALLARQEVQAAELHGLSFGMNHAAAALELASRLKRAHPASHVLCGGIHTTLNAESVLHSPGVDSVALGEADETLLAFVQDLEKHRFPVQTPGIWTHGENGVHRNPLPPLPDLKEPSPPFFDGIDYRAIITANRGFVNTIVGRGCAADCNYCHNAAIVRTVNQHSKTPVPPGGFCRRRRVEHIIDELLEFERRYGLDIKAYHFGDDNFAGSLSWLREFSTRYLAEIGKPFICNAIPGQIGERTAGLLAEAGCNMVKFGVESGSERIRTEMLNRRMSEKKLAEAVGYLRRHGINTRAYVMLGVPGETRAEMESTWALCSRLEFDSVRPSILYPFPGTEIHRRCVAQGLITPDRSSSDYSSTTVLALTEPERRHIEQTAVLFAWLLNMELGGGAARMARPIVARIRSMLRGEWAVAMGRSLVTELGRPVHDELSARGVDHYFAPFSDRPDVIFLYRDRLRPLINVEG